MIHSIKVWPRFYTALATGEKCFELRYNDRDYKEGDILKLCEFDPMAGKFTGREIKKKINYLVSGSKFGLKDKFVALGLIDLRAE